MTTARPSFDPAALEAALRGLADFAALEADALEPMRTKGLVHEHVRIRGSGLVLRVPRSSAFGLAPADNLAYQAAAFARAAPSHVTPRLYCVIAPAPGIPFGALLVDEISGRPPRLPDDMSKIAASLAAIHTLPVPAPDLRPPLPVHDDPIASTLAVIRAQAAFIPRAGLAPDAQAQISDELVWSERFAACAPGRDHPIALVGTDTHPGNFLIQAGGRAVFVDFEKVLYGSPAIDLAHASVYTSTMWDPDCAAALTPSEVAAFYDDYLARLPRPLVERLEPWLLAMRRLTWLRTTSWAAKWRIDNAAMPDLPHIIAARARIADYFDPATIERVRGEWRAARL